MKDKIYDFFLTFGLMTCLVLIAILSIDLGLNKINNKPSTQPKYSFTQHIGNDFYVHMEDFLDYAYTKKLPKEFNQRLNNLTVKYGNPKKIREHFAGYCDTNTTTIIVDYSIWKNYGFFQRQAFIDHELGHCLLERNHRHVGEGTSDNFYPYSIMYPIVLTDSYYAQNKDFLRKELFEEKRFDKLIPAQEMGQEHYEKNIKKFASQDEYWVYINNVINEDIPKAVEIVDMEPITITAEPKKVTNQ